MEIIFDNVGYIYNEKTPLSKKVLDNVSLTIKENAINAIIGKSGSGKTTMIEMINALILPSSGKLQIGENILEKGIRIHNINSLRSKIGFVFEFSEEQFFNNTVKAEIEFALKNFKYKNEKRSKRISDSLKMVGLDDSYLERDPFTLSNGEKRKVAIASVLVFNPDVIIFDEPTVGLDTNSKNNIIRLIKLLKTKYNKTIIVVSQDVDFLHKFVDYIFILGNKKIILEGDKYIVFKESEKLKEYGIEVPKLMEFSNHVLKAKGVKMGYRDEINDLIKDIYRYVK